MSRNIIKLQMPILSLYSLFKKYIYFLKNKNANHSTLQDCPPPPSPPRDIADMDIRADDPRIDVPALRVLADGEFGLRHNLPR